MNQKTKEAVVRHGNSLLAVFTECTEKDPVALCKKLRRIENAAHKFATDYCNGDIQGDDTNDTFYRHYGRGTNGPFLTEKVSGPEHFISRVCKLLGITATQAKDHHGLFVNLDARGYAMKLGSSWTQVHNRYYAQLHDLPTIHTDMGGYGILAPDLTTK